MDPVSTLGVSAGEYLLTQSVLGVTTLLGLLGIIILFRENRARALTFENALQKKDEAHAIEMAQERKRNAELQEQRVRELVVALETVNKSQSVLELNMARSNSSRRDLA